MASASNTPGVVIGGILGGCRIVRLLGRGGMGAVYEAHQIALDRKVAFKVLKAAESAEQARARNLFIKEARVAAKLNHPNIVQIFAVGQEANLYYMIMEFVEGTNLKELLKREPLFPIDRLLRIAVKVVRGLAVAHEAQVVHRDIKPENILLTTTGEVKLADFGAAQLLSEGGDPRETVFGTPIYVAPEVIQGRPSDGRADIYALGLVLYTAVAGRHPFAGRDRKEVLRAQVAEQLLPLEKVRPGVHPGLAALIAQLCAKEPHERLSAEQLLEILDVHPEWRKEVVPPSTGAPPVRAAPAAAPPAAQQATPPQEARKKSILEAGIIQDRKAAPQPFQPINAARRPHTEEKKPEPRSSERTFQPARPLSPSAQASRTPPREGVEDLCVQARFQLLQKNLKEAEALFRKAVALNPRSQGALLGLARTLCDASRQDEAIAVVRQLLELGKLGTKALLNLPHFQPLREHPEFRRLMAERSL